MATFKDNFRIERVYFERIKTMIDVLKRYKDNVTEEPARTILENSIDVDAATLLLYRNLGEAWAELADLIQKTRELLQELDEKTEAYHDELNERIDEVNNYLMALIRALETRVDAIEADLADMGRLFTYELTRTNDSYNLTESGNAVTFSDTVTKYTHNRAHLVTVRGNVDGETTYFFPREYDTNVASGVFEWYAFGFVGDEIHEITVTLLPDNSVNVAIETTDFSSILSRLTTAETNISNLLSRMTTAETDIDTLEDQVENLAETKQDILTAGSGISIDPDTGVITNTAQGAQYSGGNSIFINNDIIRFQNSEFPIALSNEEFTNFTLAGTGTVNYGANNIFAVRDSYTGWGGIIKGINLSVVLPNGVSMSDLETLFVEHNIQPGYFAFFARIDNLTSETSGTSRYEIGYETILYFNGTNFIKKPSPVISKRIIAPSEYNTGYMMLVRAISSLEGQSLRFLTQLIVKNTIQVTVSKTLAKTA